MPIEFDHQPFGDFEGWPYVVETDISGPDPSEITDWGDATHGTTGTVDYRYMFLVSKDKRQSRTYRRYYFTDEHTAFLFKMHFC